MTFLSSFAIKPVPHGNGQAPRHLDLSEVSLVVPVHNNRQGTQRLLAACLDVFSPRRCPREIIIVDSLSSPPLTVPRFASWGLPLQVLACARPGAAAARNLGARTATGEWVLFLDSDCLPTPTLIEGYQRAMNGAVAYAGVVRAAQYDPLSRYYDTQGIFSPPPVWHQGRERPAYLITANALVWRQALAQVGGFDERFPDAGGVIWRKICQGTTQDNRELRASKAWIPKITAGMSSSPSCLLIATPFVLRGVLPPSDSVRPASA